MNAPPNVEQRVRRLLAVQFGEDEEALRADTELQGDLGADSLARAELAAGVEDEFGLDLPDLALPDVHTVGDLVRLVRDQIQP